MPTNNLPGHLSNEPSRVRFWQRLTCSNLAKHKINVVHIVWANASNFSANEVIVGIQTTICLYRFSCVDALGLNQIMIHVWIRYFGKRLTLWVKSCRLSVWFKGSGNSIWSSILSFWKYLNCSVLARLKKYVLVILFWQVCDLKMALPEMLQDQTCAVASQRLCYCLHPWNGL